MSAFDDRTVFVDVRSQDEIARPPFFPRPFLRHPSEALPEDKTLPIVVFCQSGVRSAQLVESLKEQGYERASNGGGVEEVIEALSMFDTAKGAHVAPIQTQKLALHAELSEARRHGVGRRMEPKRKVYCVLQQRSKCEDLGRVSRRNLVVPRDPR